MNYQRYLEGDHWKRVRQRALQRARHRCWLCNAGSSLEVHHRTYERVGRERDDDLVVLCGDCHSRHHGKIRAGSQHQSRHLTTAERQVMVLMVLERDDLSSPAGRDQVLDRVVPILASMEQGPIRDELACLVADQLDASQPELVERIAV